MTKQEKAKAEKEALRKEALEAEKVRRMQILADRQFKKGSRGVAEVNLAAQTQQADEQKSKWIDPYNEREKNPNHAGNLKL